MLISIDLPFCSVSSLVQLQFLSNIPSLYLFLPSISFAVFAKTFPFLPFATNKKYLECPSDVFVSLMISLFFNTFLYFMALSIQTFLSSIQYNCLHLLRMLCSHLFELLMFFCSSSLFEPVLSLFRQPKLFFKKPLSHVF